MAKSGLRPVCVVSGRRWRRFVAAECRVTRVDRVAKTPTAGCLCLQRVAQRRLPADVSVTVTTVSAHESIVRVTHATVCRRDPALRNTGVKSVRHSAGNCLVLSCLVLSCLCRGVFVHWSRCRTRGLQLLAVAGSRWQPLAASMCRCVLSLTAAARSALRSPTGVLRVRWRHRSPRNRQRQVREACEGNGTAVCVVVVAVVVAVVGGACCFASPRLHTFHTAHFCLFTAQRGFAPRPTPTSSLPPAKRR